MYPWHCLYKGAYRRRRCVHRMNDEADLSTYGIGRIYMFFNLDSVIFMSWDAQDIDVSDLD